MDKRLLKYTYLVIGPEYWVGDSREQIIKEVCNLTEMTAHEVLEELQELDAESFLSLDVIDEDLSEDPISIEKSLRHALMKKVKMPICIASCEY